MINRVLQAMQQRSPIIQPALPPAEFKLSPRERQIYELLATPKTLGELLDASGLKTYRDLKPIIASLGVRELITWEFNADGHMLYKRNSQ